MELCYVNRNYKIVKYFCTRLLLHDFIKTNIEQLHLKLDKETEQLKCATKLKVSTLLIYLFTKIRKNFKCKNSCFSYTGSRGTKTKTKQKIKTNEKLECTALNTKMNA